MAGRSLAPSQNLLVHTLIQGSAFVDHLSSLPRRVALKFLLFWNSRVRTEPWNQPRTSLPSLSRTAITRSEAHPHVQLEQPHLHRRRVDHGSVPVESMPLESWLAPADSHGCRCRLFLSNQTLLGITSAGLVMSWIFSFTSSRFTRKLHQDP